MVCAANAAASCHCVLRQHTATSPVELNKLLTKDAADDAEDATLAIALGIQLNCNHHLACRMPRYVNVIIYLMIHKVLL